MSGLMSIGKSALTANYAALQTTGNNIANANTVGYSRQQVELADAPGQHSSAGFLGRGVDIATVSRSYNQYLSGHAVDTGSTAAADAARLDRLSQLETLFPIGASGVGYAAGELLNSFTDLANNPADTGQRRVVLANAQELAGRFSAVGDRLTDLQSGVAQDLKTSISSVNSLAQQVAKLNASIVSMRGGGGAPNQLLDERDQLVSQISKLINIKTLPADDGSVTVMVGGGQGLVLGTAANALRVVPDEFDPSKVQIGLSAGPTTRTLAPDAFIGGSVAGLLKFQNEDLSAARNLLGQMATAISASVNTQQSLGLNLGNPATAGAAIFSVGAARVLGAAGNAGSASLSLTVSDARQVQASDYALAYDGANYQLTRLADGQSASGSPFTPAQLASGVSVDGLTLKLNGGTPATGDRFQLQAVALAAQNMTTVLSNPQGLAAASPFSASTGTANTGSATVASVLAVNPTYNGSLTASFNFTSNSGDYAWSLPGGSPASGTGSWTPGSPISLNGFELRLDGVPRSGDTVTVRPTTAVASNNGNARALAGLSGAGLVATLGAGSGAGANRAMTITDAYATTLADVGVRVQGSKMAAGISAAVATQAETARSNQSGVNLDEEAARLIQFQQSYQAASKIIQVAQKVFDTMLQLG